MPTRDVILGVLLAAAPALLGGQTAAPPQGPAAQLLPAEVSLVVRIDARALAGSPLLPRLLEHPQADNPLVRAAAAPATLEDLEAIYVGVPSTFTPASTELPILVTGAFGVDDLVGELGRARGVERQLLRGRPMLTGEGARGATYALALRPGVLAFGDWDSVERMFEIAGGEREGLATSAASAVEAAAGTRHVVGAGRVPAALRDWLRAEGGALAAPFATIDRVSFDATLGRAVDVRASVQPTTAEGRQAIEQALGALKLFGPSRFANDPDALAAIQSLAVTSAGDRVEARVTLTQGLLLRLLEGSV
ncbi:MAG TPA: hypothetical protein VIC56_07775 [Gemmatimonadota bacterium]|jgi:hypothetical protein